MVPSLEKDRKLLFCLKTRFINREGIDFSDAESMQAVQVFRCDYFYLLIKCQRQLH